MAVLYVYQTTEDRVQMTEFWGEMPEDRRQKNYNHKWIDQSKVTAV